MRAMVVDPLDPQVLYVGTDGGRVFRSANGGDSWDAASAGLAGRSVQVLVAAPFRILAGTWGDGLFRSTDGGRNWAAVQGDLNVLNVSGVVGDPAARDGLLMAAYLKGIFYSADGGRTWAPRQTGLSTEDISSLVADPSSPTTVYVLTTDGIFKSTDLGMKWQSINTGLAQDAPLALAVAPSDSSMLYASAGRRLGVSQRYAGRALDQVRQRGQPVAGDGAGCRPAQRGDCLRRVGQRHLSQHGWRANVGAGA